MFPLSLRFSSSYLRLLTRLPVPSNPPSIFPSMSCFNKQFLHKMIPIQLVFFITVCRILHSLLWPFVTLHFSHCQSNWSSLSLKNKRPTWCHLLFYFTSYVLNMFLTLIYPSWGACDCAVELPHWSYCSWFDVCWGFGVVGLERYPCCRLLQPATRIPLQPNHTETPTHIEQRTIRLMW